jgi:hypothetical protein
LAKRGGFVLQRLKLDFVIGLEGESRALGSFFAIGSAKIRVKKSLQIIGIKKSIMSA